MEIHAKMSTPLKERSGPLNLDDLVMDKAEVPVILVFTILLVSLQFYLYYSFERFMSLTWSYFSCTLHLEASCFAYWNRGLIWTHFTTVGLNGFSCYVGYNFLHLNLDHLGFVSLTTIGFGDLVPERHE